MAPGKAIGCIGVGKIVSAVVEAWCTAGVDVPIYLSPRNEAVGRDLSSRFPNVHRLQDNQVVLDRSDIVLLALRPPVALEVLASLSFAPRHIVVSMVSFVSYTDLCAAVSPAGMVCRAVPQPTVVNHRCPIPLFQADDTVRQLFSRIGQLYEVESEGQLQTLSTLTGLISPYYDLLQTLSDWTAAQGVDPAIAGNYVVDFFESLAYAAQQAAPPDFHALSHHAATPGGMNEQSAKQIRDSGAHEAWLRAADKILARFSQSPTRKDSAHPGSAPE
ncbi:NAD(P)-binding domain-containing protein [Dinghuibacter silviterrae]|uniref:Pyrroline-5-carboxylate reductase n=1 Tax=Dinghuibacter silviterrae TaxID=1539049 RepID=A0A4V3GLS0_9BACT|nr:NAD(P)-binding domain-containing protein [Dinghuibacter silviterrae]TDX00623.1 pyrroline-5-carboxylate reductase [Dinghuibacter silviterrae]